MTRGRPHRSGRDRRGFSLAELAVTVMIVGILAGVAVPNLHHALLKAEAARLVGEARTVRLAALDHLADNGSFPPSSGTGTVPSALAPYLPENYTFTFNGVRFGWFSMTLPMGVELWGSRHIGILLIDYSARRDLAQPMRAHAGPEAYWSATMFYFITPA